MKPIVAIYVCALTIASGLAVASAPSLLPELGSSPPLVELAAVPDSGTQAAADSHATPEPIQVASALGLHF